MPPPQYYICYNALPESHFKMNETLGRAFRWYYTITWPIEELIVTCPLLQNCGVRAKFGTATIADAFLGRSFCLEKFLARSLNFLFTGKLINLGENLLTLWELYLPFDQYLVLCKSFTFQKRIKTYLKWSCFFDWLSETKMIIVRVLFFRKTKSIVLLSFIVIIK